MLAQPTLSHSLGMIPDSAVSGIISQAALAGWDDVIPMAGGEPTFDLISGAVEAFKEFDERDLTKYSPFRGYPELLSLLCTKLKLVNGVEVEPEDVVVVPGGAGALWGAIMAVSDPGSEIIVTDPCWEHYHSIIYMTGARPVTWSMFDGPLNGSINFTVLESLITPQTRAILVNTPLNPCGYVFTETDLRHLVGLCEQRGIHLICDEEYEAFVYGGRRHLSPRVLSRNVISLHSMSKGFSLTGIRIGYVVARPEVVSLIRRAALYSYMYPSSTAQCIAIAVLRQDYLPYLESVRVQYEGKACRMYELLRDLSGVEVDFPQGGVYLFPKLPTLKGQNAAYALIQDQHLLCVPGDVAGHSSTGRVRFFMGCSDATIEDAMQRIRNCLKDGKS